VTGSDALLADWSTSTVHEHPHCHQHGLCYVDKHCTTETLGCEPPDTAFPRALRCHRSPGIRAAGRVVNPGTRKITHKEVWLTPARARYSMCDCSLRADCAVKHAMPPILRMDHRTQLPKTWPRARTQMPIPPPLGSAYRRAALMLQNSHQLERLIMCRTRCAARVPSAAAALPRSRAPRF
jgi:hypothetical protein